MRVVGNGTPHLLEAHLRVGDVLVALEHGIARRHEQHAVEPERLAHLLGHAQMPHVYGVERAAHDTQARRRPIASQIVEPMP